MHPKRLQRLVANMADHGIPLPESLWGGDFSHEPIGDQLEKLKIVREHVYRSDAFTAKEKRECIETLGAVSLALKRRRAGLPAGIRASFDIGDERLAEYLTAKGINAAAKAPLADVISKISEAINLVSKDASILKGQRVAWANKLARTSQNLKRVAARTAA